MINIIFIIIFCFFSACSKKYKNEILPIYSDMGAAEDAAKVTPAELSEGL